MKNREEEKKTQKNAAAGLTCGPLGSMDHFLLIHLDGLVRELQDEASTLKEDREHRNIKAWEKSRDKAS